MAYLRSLPRITAGVVSIAVTLQAQQRPVDPRPQATFKTGIDIVQLDVSVFDKDRRPIRGLTMEDFTVIENGKPQPLVALVPVDVAEDVAPSAAWLRDASLETVTNAGAPRRLITIVLDDAGTGFDLGESKSARHVANAIVDQMGPDDLASVVFTYLGKPQNWTADRARLRAAIESFIPHAQSPTSAAGRGSIAPAGALPAGSAIGRMGSAALPLACTFTRGKSCVVDTLWTIGSVLENAPAGRKIIMLISSNGALNVMDNPDQISDINEMFRALQRVNATVYAFDPRGLTTAPTGVELEDLRSIAAATGGRVVANTNAPEARVPEVFRANASYYLLGFRPTDTSRDGRFRRLQVRVNRPGAEVRTRLGYFAPRSAPPRAAKNPKSVAPLDAALTGVLPATDLPITLGVAPFAVPGQSDAAIVLVAGLTHDRAPAGTAHRTNLIASIFDKEGRSYGTHRQTIELKSGADALAYDVYSRIRSVKPGSYEVRVAVESEGRAGSVFASVEVPNFAKSDLALSGVLIERLPSPVIANAAEIASIVSVKPTSVRSFTSADRARAFLRVYQKQRRPVRVAARIVNERNESVFSRIDDLTADATAPRVSADYFVELPLASLSPGRYLLTLDAAAGDKRLAREVRFAVK